MQRIRSMSGKRSRMRRSVAVVGVLAISLIACGGDDDAGDDAGSDTTADAGANADSAAGADDGGDTSSEASADAGNEGGDAAGGGGGSGGGGSLVLGDETIALDSALCYLEEQDAAAGGGKILFVAQGTGTNAAGEEVLIDVSRYDEDSQFVGDDILVNIGDVLSGESVEFTAGGEIGTVTVDGSTVSADGLTFSNFDEGIEQPGSFQIDC